MAGQFTYDGAAEAMRALLRGRSVPMPCSRQRHHGRRRRRRRQTGVRAEIGRDIGIVGYDNTPVVRMGAYQLTSVDIGVDQIVAAAVDLVRDMHSLPRRAVFVEPRLEARRSTAGPDIHLRRLRRRGHPLPGWHRFTPAIPAVAHGAYRHARRGALTANYGQRNVCTRVQMCNPSNTRGGSNMRIIRIVAAAALLSAAAQPVLAQTTINFIGTETPETWQAAIDRFQELHPEIVVAYQQIPFGSFNAQIEARVGSQDPTIDVYMADTPRVPALAAKGYLSDLSALAAEISAIATPTEQTAVSYQGTFYALPMWTGTQMVYYNRDLLAKAGVEFPSDDPAERLTWDEFLDMAAKVKASGVDYGFVFAQVDRYFQLQPLFESRVRVSGACR